ncbi:MAG: YicC family protein [Myxococcales bacterium]|nr:YicC family protein [Myxococcales bacterium]
MILSMTGFGRGDATGETARIQVDIRCVNHRFLDQQLRMPRTLMPLEAEVRELVKTHFRRGRIEVGVLYERIRTNPDRIKIDRELAVGYHRFLTGLATELALPDRPTLQLVAQQPGVIELRDEDEDAEKIRPLLVAAFQKAAAAALEMRRKEGEALARDLRSTLARMRELIAAVRVAAPQAQQELENRFRERAAQWSGEIGVDPSRLQQEAALFLTKLDINEEIVRIESHFAQVEEMLGLDDSIGRRLDFLAQEMHRETTTMGNKLQGLTLTRLVLDCKAEVEKFREQVQNVD